MQRSMLFTLLVSGCASTTIRPPPAPPSAPRAEPSPVSTALARSTVRPARPSSCPPSLVRSDEAPESKQSKSVAVAPLRATLRQVLPAAQRCFDSLAHRGYRGRVRLAVRFVITPDGTVSCSDPIQQSGGDDEFADCLADTVLLLRFAPAHPARGPIIITHPFEFIVDER